MKFELPWKDIAEAPKDGTLLILLVDYGDDDADHPLENKRMARTIGFNNFDHNGEDHWDFAGWCWEHDHFVEVHGNPIAFMLVPEAPEMDEAESTA